MGGTAHNIIPDSARKMLAYRQLDLKGMIRSLEHGFKDESIEIVRGIL